MMRFVAVVAVVVFLFGPATALTAYALLAPANSACAPSGTAVGPVGSVPTALTASTTGGDVVRLDRVQLGHAATIITTGSRTQGAGRDGILVALMAALTESHLRMLANPGAYPDSTSYPHDGTGQDHDSLGLFQMRPAAGWGTVAQLMDPGYQSAAFFGGPTGPNHGSPRGLLDIPDWQQLPKGAAAQAVEVSAFPDRYAQYEPVARAILERLTTEPSTGTPGQADSPVVSSRIVFPLPAGTWTRTSGFGIRTHPETGERKMHAGTDYAAPAGTPVLALADGVVAYAGPDPYAGNLIVIDHTIAGPGGAQRVASAYAHVIDGSTAVVEGDHVNAGVQIAQVGSTGLSIGPHLHLELHPGGFDAPAIDPEPWLAAHSPTSVDGSAVQPATGCSMEATP
ncbi:M23 family metallopeptidase [Promicromonospora iranensis]|uniref:Murein DD-endopeptidase MepM/ murein hydrolase activator NlpD n=1 Tax=Promicromonospora iranensis TaxID=1105144 RepID=A0ABU2CIR7_9MICO|nr:M23 family metallopeptidase [Promicromonospora iranensis]MDR7381240.1 murein DD-endopeptidase MepM/ murein hydrolase activator NlpD [Promicromonospora iranensis]